MSDRLKLDAGLGRRSAVGKMLLAGAVERSPEGHPRRIRLAPIADFSAASLRPFVEAVAAPRATVNTDGWSGYSGLEVREHTRKVVSAMAAHVVLRWTDRVFSNIKRWALGTFHGLRRPHLRRYLDEFVWRWNRRRHAASAFDRLLGLGARLRPATARETVAGA
jgi:transposase-like protein